MIRIANGGSARKALGGWLGNGLRTAGFLCALLLGPIQTAQAYTFTSDPPTIWPNGSVRMNLKLGTPGRTLLDGNTSWNVVAQQALASWNDYLGTIQFSPVTQTTGAGTDGDRANQSFFSSTIYGKTFGSGVLAVTTGWRIGATKIEADVIFNNAISWDSYRGPLRYPSGRLLCDIKRVAVHEFGHALGLDHPDQAGQSVSAIMNSIVSNLDGLAEDDIDGARTLYPSEYPTITTDPQGRTVAVGGSVTFTVVASGTQPLRYQWHFNGEAVSGATNASYAISNVQAAHAGEYTVTVSNGGGTVTSAPAVLSVNSLPTITLQPQSQVANTGTSVTLSVEVSGSEPFSYQWYKGRSPLAGATAATYFIGAVQPSDAGDYQVRVSNSIGTVDSAIARLTVQSPPVISTQPQSQSVSPGTDVSFQVVATGDPVLTYQWKLNGANIAGATSASLTRLKVQSADSGGYSVEVSNPVGSVESDVAYLTVNAPPTINLTAQADGSVLLNLSGPAGRNLTIYVSEDLLTWNYLTTLFNQTGTLQFGDAPSETHARFYRAIAE